MIIKPTLLGAALFGIIVTNAVAKDALRVTCTQDGKIVYKGELPANAGQEERMFVYAKNPDALCIFLQDGPSLESFGNVSSQGAIEAIASGRVEGATTENTPSSDLATALAMISSGQPAPAMPIDLTDAMQKFRQETGAIDQHAPAEQQKLLNLTIGIYRSVPANDVISHWKAMQKEGPSLKNLTPTLTNVADITMLSVENIADENAGAICEDAAILGSGCIAFY
jgi:hypothetical protein